MGAIPGVLLGLLLTAGCADGPAATAPVPGAERPYPSLASVPPRPVPSIAQPQRAEIVEALRADAARARAAARALRAETDRE